MKLNQISVFLENQPGKLAYPCKVLADAGINIVTVSLADTEQFGILRLIICDWQRAKAALEKSGCVLKVSEVVAVEVDDRPGGLAEILNIIEECNIKKIIAKYIMPTGNNTHWSIHLVFKSECKREHFICKV